MGVLILEKYISEADAASYAAYLEEHSRASERPGIINALGYESSLQASTVSSRTGVIIGRTEPINFKLAEVFESSKRVAEDYWGHDMDLCQSNYQKMLPGASNPLHADSINLDGTPIQPDGTPEEVEWSGLLFLSSHGVEFTGGVLTFPEFNITYYPQVGDLLIFKGDIEHRHDVSEVLTGERENIVFFWAKRGNVSGTRQLFEY